MSTTIENIINGRYTKISDVVIMEAQSMNPVEGWRSEVRYCSQIIQDYQWQYKSIENHTTFEEKRKLVIDRLEKIISDARRVILNTSNKRESLQEIFSQLRNWQPKSPIQEKIKNRLMESIDLLLKTDYSYEVIITYGDIRSSAQADLTRILNEDDVSLVNTHIEKMKDELKESLDSAREKYNLNKKRLQEHEELEKSLVETFGRSYLSAGG